jgi:hypothetical protein
VERCRAGRPDIRDYRGTRPVLGGVLKGVLNTSNPAVVKAPAVLAERANPLVDVSSGYGAVEIPGELTARYGLGGLEGYRNLSLMAALRPEAGRRQKKAPSNLGNRTSPLTHAPRNSALWHAFSASASPAVPSESGPLGDSLCGSAGCINYLEPTVYIRFGPHCQDFLLILGVFDPAYRLMRGSHLYRERFSSFDVNGQWGRAGVNQHRIDRFRLDDSLAGRRTAQHKVLVTMLHWRGFPRLTHPA